MNITAQVSLYPVSQGDFIPPIDAAIAALDGPDLKIRVQPMSTLVEGEEAAVFAALRRAFDAGVVSGTTVMVVTLANASLITHPF